MNKYLLPLLFSLCFFLQACSDNPTTAIAMEVPPQLRAVNDSNVIADLSIDAGPPTRITFTDSSAKTVYLSSIMPDQQYDYAIDWFELIDGVQLPLSRQTGVFTLSQDNSTANLDGVHLTSYDEDGDLIENLTERQNGTCPWMSCDSSGNLTDPNGVVTVSLSNDETMTYQGAGQWVESASTLPEMQFFWRTVRITRTSIFLEDMNRCTSCSPFRSWLMEIDLSRGRVMFSYNEEDDAYFQLYDIEGIE